MLHGFSDLHLGSREEPEEPMSYTKAEVIALAKAQLGIHLDPKKHIPLDTLSALGLYRSWGYYLEARP